MTVTAEIPRGLATRSLRRSRAAQIAVYSALISFILFFVVPLVWLALAPSHASDEDLNSNPLRFGSLASYWDGWTNLMTFADDDRLLLFWGLNSVIFSVAAVLFATALGVTAGYGLAFFRFPGRRAILLVTIVTMVVPQNTLVLPLFLELSKVGLIGSRWAVILPSGFFPLGVFLSYIYFTSHFPRQLLNAARIDGCGELRLFVQVVLPLTRNVLALIAFFAFWTSWVNYFMPSILLNDPKTFSLPVGIVSLTQSTNAFFPSPQGFSQNWPIERPEIALAGLFSVLPVIIIFAFSQRFLQQGPLAGAEKT